MSARARRSSSRVSLSFVASTMAMIAACRGRGESGGSADAAGPADGVDGSSRVGSVDGRTAAGEDASLGALFEAAKDRPKFARDVAADAGEAGVVQMLVESASVVPVESDAWESAYASLSPSRAAEVATALASFLEPGKPTTGLRRAVTVVDLREASRRPLLASRIRELSSPLREPRALAVMLRTLASVDAAEAAAVGCEVLGHAPLTTGTEKGTPSAIDRPGREALVEAALIAIAHGRAEPGSRDAGAACPQVASTLGEEYCMPFFRCGPDGPLTGRETSLQDEPLCTAPQLDKAVATELARSPKDVLAMTSGTRPELFAFATLAKNGALPESLRVAHARRRYALTQPKDPPCESGLEPGKPCHCDEATVRDQACRQHDPGAVRVGVCRFDIDDKKKRLGNVAAVAP